MTKKEFIKALKSAKVDEKGRLYILGKYDNKIYFGVITTICEDLFTEIDDNETDQIYDRHYGYNDDTLEIHIVNHKNFDIKDMTESKRIRGK